LKNLAHMCDLTVVQHHEFWVQKWYSLGYWIGAEDGIVVDTPCEDSSTWGVNAPLHICNDTTLNAEDFPNGDLQSE